MFRNVETSFNVKAKGTHIHENTPYSVEDEYFIKAHQPLMWKADLVNESNTFNGKEANVPCVATQMNGPITADIEFEWFHAEGETRIFDGSSGFKIRKGKVVSDNGTEYITSTLVFKPKADSEQKFICNASLKAKGRVLHKISRDVSVASGG